MNQLFKLRNEKNWKSLLLTPDNIMLVNKVYKTPEVFVAKFQEKEFLKQRSEISISDITEVRHPEEASNVVKIFYNAKNKRTELELKFEDMLEQQQFINAIVKPKKMIATTAQVSVMKAIGAPLTGLAITLFFTFITYSDAQIIEEGGEVNTSGRRSLYKELFAWLGKTLGTQGTLLAGGALSLLCIYFIYKNLRSRPLEVIYS